MKDDDRMNRQAVMVQRMASLITQAAPEEGTLVHLRFINKSDKFDDLKPSDLSSKMNFVPNGSTKLGTNLKGKVLSDFLYGPVDNGQTLKRPLLILTVTDGCPNEEPTESYENEIRASLNYVKAKGYGDEGKLYSWLYIGSITNSRAAVRYDLSQVGNAAEATKFLESWQMNTLVPDNVNVTAGRW
jgi:hypothetical protein